MKRWILPLLMAAAACGLVIPLAITHAQPGPPPEVPLGPPPDGLEGVPPGPPPGPGMMRQGPGGPADAREDGELREMVETVMMAKLANKLGLTQEQAVQMVRSRSKFKDEMRRLEEQRRDLLKALKDSVSGDKPDEAAIDAKLNELIAHDEKVAGLRRQAFDEASKGLTSVQRAKLYVFVNEFESDMRRLVQRARERMGGQDFPGAMREGGPRAGGRFGGGGLRRFSDGPSGGNPELGPPPGGRRSGGPGQRPEAPNPPAPQEQN